MQAPLIPPVISRFVLLGLLYCTGISGRVSGAPQIPDPSISMAPQHVLNQPAFILDWIQPNPGEPKTKSVFCDPNYLVRNSYNGQVTASLIEAAVTFDSLDPQIFPKGSQSREWVDKLAGSIEQDIQAAHKAGIKLYPFTQIIVFPKSLCDKYHDEMYTGSRIDIHKPFTEKVIRAQISEIFTRFPDLDGLTVRWGETYLVDVPYHTGGNPITRGMQSQVMLIKLLRDEVCVKRNKQLFYRTWGKDFHFNPDYYLKVTDQIAPHSNLVFSIKYMIGDYHRMQIFNPTLGIGKHRQVVEIQCQYEDYGKGAHPYYVGQGVIDGWEELQYRNDEKIRQHFYGESAGRYRANLNCLRDFIKQPQYAGILTGSRGGGWNGPYITNELWCELNAFVITKWVQDPERSEKEIVREFARDKLGLMGADQDRFYQICVLSAAAVLRGHCSYYAKNAVWWTRDDVMGGINEQEPGMFDQVIKEGVTEKMIAEKAESVAIWRQIKALSLQLEIPDPAMKEFVRTSCSYGCIEFEIIEKGWTVMLLGTLGDKTGNYDRDRIAKAISDYDRLWREWKELKDSSPSCATLYHSNYCKYIRGFKMEYSDTGLDSSINKYRQIVSGKNPVKKTTVGFSVRMSNANAIERPNNMSDTFLSELKAKKGYKNESTDIPSEAFAKIMSERKSAPPSEQPGEAQFQIYIPATVKILRAAFYISCHGMGNIESSVLRKFAEDEKVALVGFKGEPVQRGLFPVSLLDEPIQRLATLSNHPELSEVPFFAFGHSNGTGFSASLASQRPEKVIAWISYHPGYSSYLQFPNVERVPALIMHGMLDDWFHRNDQDKAVATMRKKRNAAMAMMLEASVGHSPVNEAKTWEFIVEYCKAAMRIRLGDNGRLKPLKIESGWLGGVYDKDKGGQQLLEVATYTDFTGDKSTANWLPDGEFARKWSVYGNTMPN